MPNTTNRNWPYPSLGENPYYDKFVEMLAAIDIDVQDLFDTGGGGGAGTLQETCDLGNTYTTTSISATDYVSIADLGATANVALKVSQTSAGGDVIPLAVMNPDGGKFSSVMMRFSCETDETVETDRVGDVGYDSDHGLVMRVYDSFESAMAPQLIIQEGLMKLGDTDWSPSGGRCMISRADTDGDGSSIQPTLSLAKGTRTGYTITDGMTSRLAWTLYTSAGSSARTYTGYIDSVWTNLSNLESDLVFSVRESTANGMQEACRILATGVLRSSHTDYESLVSHDDDFITKKYADDNYTGGSSGVADYSNLSSPVSSGSIAASGGTASGSVDMGDMQTGIVGIVRGKLGSGTSTAVVIELYDGDPSGSGSLLYQGTTWDPISGDYDDRVAFGIDDLTDGVIWWQVTNNGSATTNVDISWAVAAIE